ncbi:MAG: hypothetical protein K0S47_1841 [Herbinix sp.]|nr:hypothetical protein [Herbinix sp.]
MDEQPKRKNRKRVITVLICILFLLIILLLYKNNGIYAKKQTSILINLEDARYLNTLFIGKDENTLYYAISSTKDTVSPLTVDLHLIGIDLDGKLLFQTFIEGGSSYGATLLKDKIYIPEYQSVKEVMRYRYQVYDLNGNYIFSDDAPGSIAKFVSIRDQVYAIVGDNYFYSYLWNTSNKAEKLEFGSDFAIRDAYVLPDETTILIGETGYLDDQTYVHMTGARVCRIDGNKVLWSKILSERYEYNSISNSNLILGVSSGNVIHGIHQETYVLDFNGNVILAPGTAYSQGLKSIDFDTKYQFSNFYTNHGYWDILLLKYKYRTNGISDSSQIEDYLLSLNNDGTFHSRKKLHFNKNRDVISILENKNGKRIFLTAQPDENKVALEIFHER